MGEEILTTHFRKQDFRDYRQRLETEMAVLREWFAANEFDSSPCTGGFEVEAWLLDKFCNPAPINRDFLEKMNDPMVVPELSAFNVELNTEPQPIRGGALGRMHRNLQQTWDKCRQVAAGLDADLLMTGILPTVRESQLALNNMSSLARYRALNEQILRQRKGEALHLDISGRDLLDTRHHDVMLEAAATSFQLHLKPPAENAVRFYNAAIILAAPMVAVSANSPYLFGRDLWDETRIPLFEQAVSVASSRSRLANRVTFGKSYAVESLLECFEENLLAYPVLLPEVMNDGADRMNHVRLHNGTIWRWNRPLLGFNDDGTPHLRIEHRVMPSGPGVVDTIANAAFFYGLVYALANRSPAPEHDLSFETARSNFYTAAKNSLNAQTTWIDGKSGPMLALLTDVLLPMAQQGLVDQELDRHEIDYYLGVIAGRLGARCNGTSWQRFWIASHGTDMAALTAAYAENQRSGLPVHEWPTE